MIAKTTWKVGGNTGSNIGDAVPKTAYANEITSPIPTSTSTTGETEYTARIGLMYVSDYGFAASPNTWTDKLYHDDRTNNLYLYWYEIYKSVNWMAIGSNEWTISRKSDNAYSVFCVESDGSVGSCNAKAALAVRPVFYLVSSATYSSGDGTYENPIRLGDYTVPFEVN